MDAHDVLTVSAANGLLSTAYDVDQDELTLIVVVEPLHGTLVVADDGSYVYTPDINFDGTDTFTFAVSDGRTTNIGGPQSVTIQVVALTPPIQADNDTYYISEDAGSVVFDVLSNDDLYGASVQITVAGIVAMIDGQAYPDSSESSPHDNHGSPRQYRDSAEWPG